ncbi:transcription factor [Zymoseptoria tritici IPO323]|uniref:Transcription factor n=2 Tax=Zymoseptoria tritici TaxID=1047171 RepID=F9X438_ZYMTI|nr:transcription factor [Zymoseptoria tritici IPO323]EGP89754.1 transcription factor [Zymoseptoria tritici IPO323]
MPTAPSHAHASQTIDTSLSAILASHMDGRQSVHSQSGLSSPYDAPEQQPAVHYQPGQDFKPNYSASATPESGYHPQSARSGSFPEYVQQPQRFPAGTQASNMAQTSNPSIAQSSPTYPPPHNYSPYPPQHEMPQYSAQPMTSYGRPEWAGQYPQQMGYHSPATTGGAAPNMVAHAIPRPPAGGHPLSTVYSFVPIPGAQQHKRPRRRYEEIERMYKCGWNGCEKAYGTLNHLNAHVTMQSHGTKRTPEEFKEIRKEWKAKKKEEENSRKAEEERQRQEAQRSGQDTSQPQGQPGQYGQPHMMAPSMGGPQLPPIGYQPASGQPGQYAQPQQVDGAQQYGYGAQGYPQSPYGQGGMPYQQQQ